MTRKHTARAMTWLAFLLLLGLSWGQNRRYDTFDWRPVERPRQASRSQQPYRDDTHTTTSYDSRYFETNPDPYLGSTGYFQGSSSKPYDNSGPGHYQDNMDPGSYSSVDSSYSSDFPKVQPYQYPDDSGSYEQYGAYGVKDDNFNITMERYGGFGGTGDTRGYGAYDYPKKVQEVPQDLHEEQYNPRVETEYPDLLRIGRSRSAYNTRTSTRVHPLPPPL